MKRARAPSTSTENDNAVPTEQRDQTSQMSVQQIASLCDAIDNEAAREIASALKKSVTSNQGQLRTLCTTWGPVTNRYASDNCRLQKAGMKDEEAR